MCEMMITWNFPSNNWGERRGLNDSGIETFKGTPLKSLAREICQNSLDAGIEGECVRVVFDKFYVDPKTFPGHEEFLDAMEKSRATGKNLRDRRTNDFFSKAIDLFREEKIPFLRISDYHTTGLRGSDKEKDTDWYNLVKSSGSSDKGGKAGGSFGIGKYATFACSSLRTVFYSTIDDVGLEATQGVARLVSFRISETSDEETQGTGYFGVVEKNKPQNECVSYQEGYKRHEQGTDIFIAGFKDYNEWDKIVISEVLDSFLYAIFTGTLEFSIGEETVNQSTLANILIKYNDFLSRNTKHYYEVITSAKTYWHSEDFRGYGNIKLGLLILGEDAPKRVAMIRYPWMKIKEQDRLPNMTPFAGVFIVEGADLNNFLRKLENPEHNTWQPDRAPNASAVETAKTLISAMKKTIVDHLNILLMKDGVEEVDVVGAGDLIPIEDDKDNGSDDKSTDILSPKVTAVEVKKIERIKTSNASTKGQYYEFYEEVEGELSGSGTETQIPPHGDGKHGVGKRPGDQERGIVESEDNTVLQPVQISPLKIRLICLNKWENKYRINFTSEYSADKCSIEINQLDEQGAKSPLKILLGKVNDIELTVEKNRLQFFQILKDEFVTIDFVVDVESYFSAEVIIHGIKK